MPKRATIGDIARRVGVSKAAVSYALNGQPGVGAQTRARVLATAQEMGWYASSSARALSGAETGFIGLTLGRSPELLAIEPYFMRFLSGVESALAEQNVSLVFRVTGENPEAEIQTYRRWWGERRIDGVILLDERYRDIRIAALEQIGLPAVLCGGPRPGSTLPCLWTDQAADAAEVVNHLAALGHRRIAHVSGPRHFMHERQRRRAVRSAARLGGLGEVTTVEAEYTGPGAGEIARRLLGDAEPPTAIIYGSDVMATAGLGAALELGVRVPEQLSIVSWDDSQLTTLVHPPLTALSRDVPGYGALAARTLLDLLGGRHRGQIQQPVAKLVVRESTGPAPRRTRRRAAPPAGVPRSLRTGH
jgi:DNA-binding LacI/PurR family transcriptional regulator